MHENRKIKNKKFPFTIEQLFNEFANLANTSGLHCQDWKRYYRFIRACRYHRFKDTELLRQRLIDTGFSEDYADYLVGIFNHGYEILSTKVPEIAMSLSSYYWTCIYSLLNQKKIKSKFLSMVKKIKPKRIKNDKVSLILEIFPDDPIFKDQISEEIKKAFPEVISVKFSIKP